jgi:lipopolysaccharide/colanic/teichoic acid biosynthesis glycosyltransferase
LDAVWVTVAPFVALALRDDALLRFDLRSAGSLEVYQYALITIACALPAVALFRLGDGLSRDFAFSDLWAVLAAAGVAASASAAFAFTINRLDYIPRSTPLIYAIVLLAGLVGGRVASRALASASPRGEADGDDCLRARARRVIVVGVDRFATLAIKLVEAQAPRAVEVVGALDPSGRFVGRAVNGVRIVGALADLRPLVDEYAEHGVKIEEVWVSDGAAFLPPDARRALFAACDAIGLRCASLSRALNLVPVRPVAAPSGAPAPAAPRYFRLKRPLEAVGAALLLALLAPAAAIVAATVAFDVGAPVVFWQERVGREGRRFLLYKFRTYQAPFDRAGRAVPREARMSKVGALVRRSRLDEIPQLWNVLRGEMSLIGPRPLLPVDQPEDARTRLMVRPGVTGWAQVNGATLVTAEEKDALDAWYIHHASPALDLRIALKTAAYLVRGERKDDAAIEAAFRWRLDALERERRPPGERTNEAAAEAAEQRPASARYVHVEAAS